MWRRNGWEKPGLHDHSLARENNPLGQCQISPYGFLIFLGFTVVTPFFKISAWGSFSVTVTWGFSVGSAGACSVGVSAGCSGGVVVFDVLDDELSLVGVSNPIVPGIEIPPVMDCLWVKGRYCILMR
jgi:hypothetical protein